MRFVLGNRHFIAAGGTEVHLMTLGEQLQRLGHEVVLYAPQLGPFAEHARRRGLDITDALEALPADCDVVFSQDSIAVYPLVERYPEAFSVFRICGDLYDFQLPPQVSGIVDLVVALSDRSERLARACAVQPPVVRLTIPVDADRLVSLGPLRDRPRRAVLLGNYTTHDALIRAAWEPLGIDILRVGGELQSYDVAAAVAEADIVVAKNRAALDAMACERAVYILDMFGGDGWVTPEVYPALEADHFAGQATGRVIDADTLADDLAAYRPGMGAVNRDLVLQHHGARDHAIGLLAALGDRCPPAQGRDGLQELGRLTAVGWSWELAARELGAQHWPMRDHAAETEREALAYVADLQAAVAAAQEATRAATAYAEGLAHARASAVARVEELEAQLARQQLAPRVRHAS
ncbi:MAG: hypothetical protein ACJ762_03755 [Solirubrobacteraceae bacterium]